MTPEGRIKAKFLREIAKVKGLWHFAPVQQGFGKSAHDRIICAGGYFVSVEFKAPGKKMTARQQADAAAIKAAGGMFLLVDSFEAVTEAVTAIREIAGHYQWHYQ